MRISLTPRFVFWDHCNPNKNSIVIVQSQQNITFKWRDPSSTMNALQSNVAFKWTFSWRSLQRSMCHTAHSKSSEAPLTISVSPKSSSSWKLFLIFSFFLHGLLVTELYCPLGIPPRASQTLTPSSPSTINFQYRMVYPLSLPLLLPLSLHPQQTSIIFHRCTSLRTLRKGG